jgi:hypothetical protein
VLLCFFHHQIIIHRWAWTLVLNPDGTTTAWNPDRTKSCTATAPRPGRVARPGAHGCLVTPTITVIGRTAGRERSGLVDRKQLNDTGGRGLVRWHELVVSRGPAAHRLED